MYALMRDGFIRDVVLVLIITVLVGSAAAATVSAAADRFFEDTVSGIVGDYGEYDVIVHVRQEACQEAARALEPGAPPKAERHGAFARQLLRVLAPYRRGYSNATDPCRNPSSGVCRLHNRS